VNSADEARARLLAYRRSLARPPRLARQTVSARGLAFAIFFTPAIPDALPVVCINGGLLYDHTLLWPALAPLARRRQLVFYDQRGRGLSESPADTSAARIEHDADDVGALREALGIRNWDVLGHSWGGGIAMLAAERDRVGTRRLVLVDAAGPTSSWLERLHDRAIEHLAPPERAALARFDPVSLREPLPGLHSAYSRALYPAWFSDPQFAHAFAPPRSESLTGTVIASRLRRDGYDWTRSLRAVQARTLVMHGERDLLPPGQASDLTALISQARFELIPDCGHMPFWEAPGTFFELVDSFLVAP
jgi:proline iminopeptidase